MRRGRKRSGTVAAVALDAAIGNGSVFQIDLRDTATGARPAGRAPVYRPFDVRADANRRYGASAIVRAQREAAGSIREGYGRRRDDQVRGGDTINRRSRPRDGGAPRGPA